MPILKSGTVALAGVALLMAVLLFLAGSKMTSMFTTSTTSQLYFGTTAEVGKKKKKTYGI
jgi:hypothetical protein